MQNSDYGRREVYRIVTTMYFRIVATKEEEKYRIVATKIEKFQTEYRLQPQ